MPSPTAPTQLVTQLLIMPGGIVLADNLTREMASCLQEMGLHPDPATQCVLTTESGGTLQTEHRLGDRVGVRLHPSTNATQTDTEKAP